MYVTIIHTNICINKKGISIYIYICLLYFVHIYIPFCYVFECWKCYYLVLLTYYLVLLTVNNNVNIKWHIIYTWKGIRIRYNTLYRPYQCHSTPRDRWCLEDFLQRVEVEKPPQKQLLSYFWKYFCLWLNRIFVYLVKSFFRKSFRFFMCRYNADKIH